MGLDEFEGEFRKQVPDRGSARRALWSRPVELRCRFFESSLAHWGVGVIVGRAWR